MQTGSNVFESWRGRADLSKEYLQAIKKEEGNSQNHEKSNPWGEGVAYYIINLKLQFHSLSPFLSIYVGFFTTTQKKWRGRLYTNSFFNM